MRQQLHHYLVNRPSGATSAELLNEIFISGAGSPFPSQRDPELGSRLLHSSLSADPNFYYGPTTDCWSLTLHTHLPRPIQNKQFVVLASETTGLKPGKAAITESAAIRMKKGCQGKEFHTLVHPGRRGPSRTRS